MPNHTRNDLEDKHVLVRIARVMAIVVIGTARYLLGYYEYRKRRSARQRARREEISHARAQGR